jgi:hypothetical protein
MAFSKAMTLPQAIPLTESSLVKTMPNLITAEKMFAFTRKLYESLKKQKTTTSSPTSIFSCFVVADVEFRPSVTHPKNGILIPYFDNAQRPFPWYDRTRADSGFALVNYTEVPEVNTPTDGYSEKYFIQRMLFWGEDKPLTCLLSTICSNKPMIVAPCIIFFCQNFDKQFNTDFNEKIKKTLVVQPPPKSARPKHNLLKRKTQSEHISLDDSIARIKRLHQQSQSQPIPSSPPALSSLFESDHDFSQYNNDTNITTLSNDYASDFTDPLLTPTTDIVTQGLLGLHQYNPT